VTKSLILSLNKAKSISPDQIKCRLFQPKALLRHTMHNIIVEKKPKQSKLDTLGVAKWPTWQKEVSVFSWVFPEQEIAYILEGECVITPEGGKPVKFGKGDLVTFPAGLKASWEVKKPLHKHYKLDGNVITQALRRIKMKIGL
jgi:uncharacterized cupin superfamily protein